MIMGFFIPPANKVWEDLYESPCPLVDAVVYSSYLYYGVTLYTKIVYNLMVFQDFDPRSFKQVHGHTEVKVHYLCLAYTCLMEKH